MSIFFGIIAFWLLIPYMCSAAGLASIATGGTIPTQQADCSDIIALGQLCLNTTDGSVTVGDGTVAVNIGSTGGTSNVSLESARLSGSTMTCPTCGAPGSNPFKLCPAGTTVGCWEVCFDPLLGSCAIRANTTADIQMVNSRFRGINAAAPSDPLLGDWYIDTTTTHHICIYNGSGWNSSDDSICA